MILEQEFIILQKIMQEDFWNFIVLLTNIILIEEQNPEVFLMI